MFDLLKQMGQLKQMQEAIKKERVEIENDGVKVTVSGEMSILEIKLNPDKPAIDQERTVKDSINQAFTEIQSRLAKNLSLP